MLKTFFTCLLLTFIVAGSYSETPAERLKIKADSAMLYCKSKGFDTDRCILIDMSIQSGQNRIFFWDFNENKVIRSGLCCHGCGSGSTGEQPVFSNASGSYCTSLGKYKIGARAYSQYGINAHYKLYGLESSNSNAYSRIIVLHSHNPVPEKEIYPRQLPMGWSLGCPVVSNNTMTCLDEYLKKAKKPVLLWIYY